MQGRSMFYFISSRNLFDCQMEFKASGCGRRCISFALELFWFFLDVNCDITCNRLCDGSEKLILFFNNNDLSVDIAG